MNPARSPEWLAVGCEQQREKRRPEGRLMNCVVGNRSLRSIIAGQPVDGLGARVYNEAIGQEACLRTAGVFTSVNHS